MEDILQQIEKALDYNLYFIALQSTLTLPDICGALETNSGEACKNNYINWFNNNFNFDIKLTAEQCYYFRCANVHQARLSHDKLGYSRIIFLEPNKNIHIHNGILNDALIIDINTFCNQLIESVRIWLNTIKGSEPFESNYKKVMQRYPTGISPYIIGIPVIS